MIAKSILVTASCLAFGSVCLPAQTAKVSAADKQFLKTAADANMTEAHLGEMAQAQASTQAVKDFGKTLAQDHATEYEQLSGVAGKTGETIPKGINVGRDRAIVRLMHMKGRSFDQSFLRDAIQDERRTIAKFQREARHGDNPAIKAYAQQIVPTLQQHVHAAEELEKPAKRS